VTLVREDDGDARARVVARDDGRVADADAGDVGDRVERPRRQGPDLDPEVARPRH
jgi:hypothetical protein